MANKTNTLQLLVRMFELADKVGRTSTWYRKNSSYTPEGKAQGMKNAAKQYGYQDALNELRASLDLFGEHVQRKQDAARAKALPTATDPTEVLAAEMAVQRVLGRGEIDQATAMKLLNSMEASPTRTLLLEEMQARDVIGDGVVDAILAQADPEVMSKPEQSVSAAQGAKRYGEEVLDKIQTMIDNPNITTTVDVKSMDTIQAHWDTYFPRELETDSPAPKFADIPYNSKVYDYDPSTPVE